MSKELEALNKIFNGMSNNVGYINYFESIRQALTPPTSDEVCKALSERYNNAGIQYLQDDKRFVFGYMLKPICWLKEDGTVYWGTNDLPPHLITLIGRFYEGEIK